MAVRDDLKHTKSFQKQSMNIYYYYNNERIQKKTKWMPPTLYRLASMNVN